MGKKLWFIILLLAFWLFALKVYGGWYDFPFLKEKPRLEVYNAYTMILSEGVYLLPNRGFDPKDEKEWVKQFIISKSWELGMNPKLPLEIVRRESNFVSDICNKTYGCRSGIGLFQIVISTLKHCQEQLGRKLDARNIEDNIDCGLWLLKNEGIGHWQNYSGPYDI